jgi:hypothetical protein
VGVAVAAATASSATTTSSPSFCAGVGDIQGLGDVGSFLLYESLKQVNTGVKVAAQGCGRPDLGLDCVKFVCLNPCHEMTYFGSLVK